jgi:hypothetical protein
MGIDHDLGAELRALSDGEFFAILAREVANRESMSSVRDALLSLVASGPTLSASVASAVPAHVVSESIARARRFRIGTAPIWPRPSVMHRASPISG